MWIASSDLLLFGSLQNSFTWETFTGDALIITLQCQEKDAEYCGIAKLQEDGNVMQISYDTLIKEDENRIVNIVGGIVYLRTRVAEALLTLSSMPALDSCTYLGKNKANKYIIN